MLSVCSLQAAKKIHDVINNKRWSAQVSLVYLSQVTLMKTLELSNIKKNSRFFPNMNWLIEDCGRGSNGFISRRNETKNVHLLLFQDSFKNFSLETNSFENVCFQCCSSDNKSSHPFKVTTLLKFPTLRWINILNLFSFN